MKMSAQAEPSFLTSLIAGGVAGIAVDVTLFPLDTIKTRLQSASGFWRCGGFSNVYKGLGPAAIGSAPIAGVFFCTYDSVKKFTSPHVQEVYQPFTHMGAACVGEIASCLVKVPTEVVKQRSQAALQATSPLNIIRQAVNSEGVLGLYRGFTSTVLREIPFVLLQFPLWEHLKIYWLHTSGKELGVFEVAMCGAMAGGVSAAITTPLDVAKTRIMLSEGKCANKQSIVQTLKAVYSERGTRGLFAGFTPRVAWITAGGAVFFGVYEFARSFCIQFAWGQSVASL